MSHHWCAGTYTHVNISQMAQCIAWHHSPCSWTPCTRTLGTCGGTILSVPAAMSSLHSLMPSMVPWIGWTRHIPVASVPGVDVLVIQHCNMPVRYHICCTVCRVRSPLQFSLCHRLRSTFMQSLMHLRPHCREHLSHYHMAVKTSSNWRYRPTTELRHSTASLEKSTCFTRALIELV